MARTRNPPPPDDDQEEGAETSAQQRGPAPAAVGEADEIEQLLERLGARAAESRITVHKIVANGEPEECIDCPLNVFSKQQLREDFGAGSYRCEVRHQGRITRRWEWRFAAPTARAPGAAAPSSADARVAELQAALTAARDRESQRAHELTLALIGRPQASGPSLGDLMGMMVQMKELNGGGGNNSTLGAVKEVLEIRELLGDGERGGASHLDLGLEALKQFGRLIDGGGGATDGAVATPATRPRPRVPGAAAQPSARDQVVALLLQHAHQNTSPSAAAQFAIGKLQQLDDDLYETACSYLESPGALAMALLLEPRLQPAKAWLQQVLDGIKPLIADSDAGEGLPAGDPPAQDT